MHRGLHRTSASRRFSKESAVIELLLVGQNVRVRVGGDGEVALTDVLPDPGPRRAAEVPERDPAVAEIVRRERRYTGRGAGAGDRRPEPVTAGPPSRATGPT